MEAENKYLKKVGLMIREKRLAAGLRQDDVEYHNISWKHYQKIESGKTNTTIKMLYRLAKAFKCSVKDLLP